MEGSVTPTSILGMDSDLPLATDIKEEIMDPTDEVGPDLLSTTSRNTSSDDNTLQHGGGSENVESPTTGDGCLSGNGWNSKCVFCDRLPTANDEPKLLECLHSACNTCISSQCEQNQVNVPEKSDAMIICKMCEMRSSLQQIIENQFLIELGGGNSNDTNGSGNNGNDGGDSEKTNMEIKCSSCSDEAIATSWCMDCQEYICDNCVQAHQRLKITKDHTIKSKDDAGQESLSSASSSVPKSLYCSMHTHERLSLFCVSCDKLTCRDCQLTEHREHKYKFIHEIAEETRASMTVLLKDVSYKRVLLSSAMTVIDDRQKLIQDKKNSLVKEITQMVVRLTNTINIRGKQLVMRLNEVCDSKQKTLQEKREALDQLSMLTDHCVSFTQHALDRGSDMALLHSKRHVLAHLNRIKSRRADIPNPEIPVRIHLALDKVPDLIKVVSSIGAIVVDGKIYPSNNNQVTNNGGNVPQQPLQSPSPQSLPAVSPQLQQINGPHQQQPTRDNSNVPLHSLSQVFGPVAPVQQPQQQQQQQRTPMGSQMLQQRQQPPSMHPIPPNQQRTPPIILPRPPYHQQQQQQVAIIRLPGGNNQQVTSSTHPQQSTGLGLSDSLNQNLRGLLQTAPPAPPGYQTQQPTGGGYSPGAIQQQQSQQQMYRMNPQQQQQQQQMVYRQPPPSYNTFQQPQMTPQQRQQVQFQQQRQQSQQMYYSQQQQQQQQQMQQQHHSQQQSASNVNQQRMIVATNPQMLANVVAAATNRQMITQQPIRAPSGAGGMLNGPPNQNMLVGYQQSNQQQMPSYVAQQRQQQMGSGGGAQWHIPQHALNGGSNQQPYNSSNDQGFNRMQGKSDDSFKITLKNITPRPSSSDTVKQNSGGTVVSSTIPKTPSPNTSSSGNVGGSGSGTKNDETELKLDKFCQDSVNDLMATIAKLDSNGVQVLAESRSKNVNSSSTNSGGSPHIVDSSTDHQQRTVNGERRASINIVKNNTSNITTPPSSGVGGGGSAGGGNSGSGGTGTNTNTTSASIVNNEVEKDDPNEDWCAVCMDGGELVCCDKCPKVFHQYCHIPNLTVEESDTWQCLLCMNFADIPNNAALGDKREPGLTPKEKKIAERIVLELYCQYEPSLPFREMVTVENTDYHTKIKKPIALDVIRQKLDWTAPGHYTEIVQLISDLRLMFRNAYMYNERGTQVYNDAQRLEEFLDQQLEKWLPAYAYEDPLRDEEDKLYPPLKRYKRIVSE